MVFHVSSLSLISSLKNLTSSNSPLFPNCFLLDYNSRIHQVHKSELGFIDREKINRIINFELALVIALVITNQALIGLLVNYRSSYNVLYEDALELLGLTQTGLNTFVEESEPIIPPNTVQKRLQRHSKKILLSEVRRSCF